MSITTIPFLTAAQIAEALDQPVVRVRHVLATRNIKPMARAGLVRMYAPDAVDRVRAELATIDAKRKAVPA